MARRSSERATALLALALVAATLAVLAARTSSSHR
jgi:hypothetical protein